MTTYQQYKQLYHNLPKPLSLALHHEDITDHPADMQTLADLHDHDPEGILTAVIAKAKDLSPLTHTHGLQRNHDYSRKTPS